MPPTAKLTTLIPEMEILDLPFLFPRRSDIYEVLDGAPGRALLDKFVANELVGVAFGESGFKHFTSNREIYKPTDFKGLNIRTMKSPIIMPQFYAYGALPILIEFHKTYDALKAGAIDGQENPLSTIYSMKFDTIQSHLPISNNAYLAQALVFNKKIFESLPVGIQNILFETAVKITPFQ